MRGVVVRVEQKIEEWCGREKAVIYLFVRGEDKKKYVFMDPFFEPYCYFRKGVLNINSFPEIRKHQIVSFNGKDYLKVWTHLPTHISKLRRIVEKKYPKGVSVFEADVLFPLRYLIDKEIRGSVEWDKNVPLHPIDEDLPSNLRVQFLDIEVLSKKILCLTIWDSYLEKYFTWYWRKSPLSFNGEEDWKIDYSSTEKEMLRKVLRFIRETDPDVITGYNVDFDLLNLRQRSLELQLGKEWDSLNPLHRPDKNKPYPIPPPRRRRKKFRDFWIDAKTIKIPGRTVLDLLEIILKTEKHQLAEYSLDYVARNYLKPSMEKLRWKGKAVRDCLPEIWKEEPEFLLRYNKHDVKLSLELDRQLSLISFADELRKLAGIQLDDIFSNKRIAHVELLRKAKTPLPATKKEEKGYKGAIVIEPKKGVYEWVIVIDFKSLYPSLILQFNIDPNTYIPKSLRSKFNLSNAYILRGREKKTEFWFRKSPEGDLPSILRNYLTRREEKRRKLREIKLRDPKNPLVEVLDTQQIALKVIANAFYGSLIYQGTPSAYQCARAVTSMAREAILFAKEEIAKLGYNVIYGDTDSLMILSKFKNYKKVVEEAEYLSERVSNKMPKFLQKFGGNKSYLTLALDKIFVKFLIDEKKKRYAGLTATSEGEGKLEVKGFGAVRSDTSKFTKELQRTLIKEILRGRGKWDIKLIVEESLKEYDRKPLTEIGVPCVLTKPPNQYKTRTVQVKAFLYSNKYLKTNFKVGNKPKRIYVRMREGKVPVEVVDRVDVLAFDSDNLKLPEWLEIDWPRMIKATVKPKIEKILKFVELDWKELRLKSKFMPLKKRKERKKKSKQKIRETKKTEQIKTLEEFLEK